MLKKLVSCLLAFGAILNFTYAERPAFAHWNDDLVGQGNAVFVKKKILKHLT